MSVIQISNEFEWMIKNMIQTCSIAQDNIESDFNRLIRVTVKSCAIMYGFSSEEALSKIDSNGNIIEIVEVKVPKEKKQQIFKISKEAKQVLKEKKEIEKVNESSERIAMKEQDTESRVAEKFALKEFQKAEKIKEKAIETAEKVAMKEQYIISKAAEKLALKSKKTKKEKKNVLVVETDIIDDGSLTAIMSSSSDEDEIHVLFQNVKLVDEINSIRDVKNNKNWKKLSTGVKLARQILDI